MDTFKTSLALFLTVGSIVGALPQCEIMISEHSEMIALPSTFEGHECEVTINTTNRFLHYAMPNVITPAGCIDAGLKITQGNRTYNICHEFGSIAIPDGNFKAIFSRDTNSNSSPFIAHTTRGPREYRMCEHTTEGSRDVYQFAKDDEGSGCRFMIQSNHQVLHYIMPEMLMTLDCMQGGLTLVTGNSIEGACMESDQIDILDGFVYAMFWRGDSTEANLYAYTSMSLSETCSSETRNSLHIYRYEWNDADPGCLVAEDRMAQQLDGQTRQFLHYMISNMSSTVDCISGGLSVETIDDYETLCEPFGTVEIPGDYVYFEFDRNIFSTASFIVITTSNETIDPTLFSSD